MTDSEALSKVLTFAKNYVDGGSIKGWKHPEDYKAAIQVLNLVESIWARAYKAENTPDGITDLALEVLKENGFQYKELQQVEEPQFSERMFVLSTSSITGSTAEWLDEESKDMKLGNGSTLNVNLHYSGDEEVGWLIRLPSEDLEKPIPADLWNVLNAAKLMKYQWVLFDRDAAVHPKFEAYDW